jgi:hypothetical protein
LVAVIERAHGHGRYQAVGRVDRHTLHTRRVTHKTQS